MLLIGCGLQHVVTDCLVDSLLQQLPSASHVTFGFHSDNMTQVARPMLSGLATAPRVGHGGLVMANRQLFRVPLGQPRAHLALPVGEKVIALGVHSEQWQLGHPTTRHARAGVREC